MQQRVRMPLYRESIFVFPCFILCSRVLGLLLRIEARRYGILTMRPNLDPFAFDDDGWNVNELECLMMSWGSCSFLPIPISLMWRRLFGEFKRPQQSGHVLLAIRAPRA